jgi:hypothetical protein
MYTYPCVIPPLSNADDIGKGSFVNIHSSILLLIEYITSRSLPGLQFTPQILCSLIPGRRSRLGTTTELVVTLVARPSQSVNRCARFPAFIVLFCSCSRSSSSCPRSLVSAPVGRSAKSGGYVFDMYSPVPPTSPSLGSSSSSVNSASISMIWLRLSRRARLRRRP